MVNIWAQHAYEHNLYCMLAQIILAQQECEHDKYLSTASMWIQIMWAQQIRDHHQWQHKYWTKVCEQM